MYGNIFIMFNNNIKITINNVNFMFSNSVLFKNNNVTNICYLISLTDCSMYIIVKPLDMGLL